MKTRSSHTRSISVIPSARRLVDSLRDLGYDFSQAVADLVDNSLSAGAARIDIDLHFDGAQSWLRISDDGDGMGDVDITEAMRYGSHQDYDDEGLGKFGLGLKTASLSQCRRLGVASLRAAPKARIAVRHLDLDHVLKVDRWEILEPSPAQRDSRLTDPLKAGAGTVVLWEALDRLLEYKRPAGKRAESALRTLTEQLELHLGMTFHRFLDGEIDGRGKVEIRINGRRVRPWDPFATTEPATSVLPPCEIDLSSLE